MAAGLLFWSLCAVYYMCVPLHLDANGYILTTCPERSVGGKLGTAGVCFSTKCEGLMPVSSVSRAVYKPLTPISKVTQ